MAYYGTVLHNANASMTMSLSHLVVKNGLSSTHVLMLRCTCLHRHGHGAAVAQGRVAACAGLSHSSPPAEARSICWTVQAPPGSVSHKRRTGMGVYSCGCFEFMPPTLIHPILRQQLCLVCGRAGRPAWISPKVPSFAATLAS